MLLKWLLTFLAILWLYQAIKPFFAENPPPKAPPGKQNRDDNDNGEYIDYEEIK